MKKNSTINISVDRLFKRYIPIAAGVALIGIIAGILVVDTVIMPHVVGIDRGMIVVPSVKGLPWEDGRQKLYEVGLLNEIRDRQFDNQVREGSIISQFPESGTKVKKGRRIAVVLSKGKEIAVVPDVRNMTERQARLELKKKGFTVGDIKRQYSEKEPLDQVIDAFPPCGTTVSREMNIDLLVSKGAKPTHAVAPNIVGESLAEARKKIEESGLSVGKVDYQNNPSLLPGTVISQSVSPGSSVPLESSIDIVVSVIR